MEVFVGTTRDDVGDPRQVGGEGVVVLSVAEYGGREAENRAEEDVWKL